ncbi:IMPACT family protein [Eisenibacter elegans]|jgi:uncharacterized YigZ family protein|uniref:IMPACT family protein n=1 Tax=Eisenibacter elegans TaxID=997 RepID=UPI0004283935|nr:YigZ family protein [Eisenibacter elegans]
MEQDVYQVITAPSEGLYKEKGSKFLAFALPVDSEEDVKQHLAALKKQYYDARHHCYAYCLGEQAEHYRANDDGEPNHSAGDPILGQIRAHQLTNTLVVVVRYFGGTKLGVSGLIQAYRTAASEALSTAAIDQRYRCQQFDIRCAYPDLSWVMYQCKQVDAEILEQTWHTDCHLKVAVRLQYAATFDTQMQGQPQISCNATTTPLTTK